MKKSFIAGLVLTCLASTAFAQTSVVPSQSSLDLKAATYRAASKNFTLAATPGDVCTLTGSASKTVYVKRISVSGTKTTAGLSQVTLYKRTTADTGGTAVQLTEVALDSTQSAATAAAAHYTANPTAGAGTIIYSNYMSFMAPAGASDIQPHTVQFGGLDLSQYVVLRGTTEQLAVNLDGATLTGGIFNCAWEWMEK